MVCCTVYAGRATRERQVRLCLLHQMLLDISTLLSSSLLLNVPLSPAARYACSIVFASLLCSCRAARTRGHTGKRNSSAGARLSLRVYCRCAHGKIKEQTLDDDIQPSFLAGMKPHFPGNQRCDRPCVVYKYEMRLPV